MTPEVLLVYLSAIALAVYATKRFFDDREAARKANQIDDLPARLTKYEQALKEAITQVFEFAKATKESELKNTAKAAGVIAQAQKSRGLPKP